jgi:ParB/RepB/Spo0J family partition protein
MKSLEKNVRYIDPNNISFDKNNPRGETEKQITSDPEFKKLITSIREYGILEPIIVRKRGAESNGFILIDGERRWRAALQANQREIPTLIANNEINGRVLAYQVHKLRKDWSKVTETKSIKMIVSEIEKDKPNISQSELKKKVIEVTNMTPHAVTDLLRLIRYDDDIIERVIAKQINMSYLVQIEQSFVGPLKKVYPEILSSFNEDKIRKVLADKAARSLLGNTRYLMDSFKEVFKNESHNEEIKQLIIDYLRNKNKDIKTTYAEFVKLSQSQPGTNAHTSKTIGIEPANSPHQGKPGSSTLPEQDVPASSLPVVSKSIKIRKKDQTQIKNIRPMFEKIAGNFSKEEYEYIKEAIDCIDAHCFKAAALMIWATGISRIYQYVSKNINEYNKCSQEMSSSPKSVYKHFCKNFQKNAANMDDIRFQSNDLQLLCFLYYKGIIKEPEFKKLKSNYDTRNDCAHPTNITLSPNEIIVIFENVHNLILINNKLK